MSLGFITIKMLLIFQVLVFFLIQTAVTVDTVVPCLTAGFSSFIALPWWPRRLGLLARQVRGESRETRRSPGKTSDFAMETTKKAAISKANIIFQIFQFLLSVLWFVGFQWFTQEPTWQGEHNSLPDKLGAQHKMTRGLERKSKICPQFWPTRWM